MAEQLNAFKMAPVQFGSVVELLDLEPCIVELLCWYLRQFIFQIQVRMKDGTARLVVRAARITL